MKSASLLIILTSTLPMAVAQDCVSLSNSTLCPAFNASSISTGPALTALFPFLAFVSTAQQFDQRLSQYITTNYVQLKYQQLLGCDNLNLKNTTNLYARYTTSVICNTIVQNSIASCSLSRSESAALCAETCAQQATSEEQITINENLCGKPQNKYLDQIRADFTNCALPSDSLSAACIPGDQNEPVDCGFSTNLQGLCGYCGASSPNATDSCCVASKVMARCEDVTIPPIFSVPPLFPSSTSAVPSPSASSTAGAAAVSSNTLSRGQIAGIVIGSVLGAALLLGLLLLCCIFLRRRRRGSQVSPLNQPTPQRKGPGMVMASPSGNQVSQPGFDTDPPGRVARMSALEGPSSDSPSYASPEMTGLTGASHRQHGDTSESEAYADIPESRLAGAPVVTGKRNGSLSSQSVMGALDDHSSPQSGSGGQFSSPDGNPSGQSEQLTAFRDYYSPDEIHPNDKVATLWAYQPRANDEFALERGDMLKVVGIWDDGWATGVRIDERAEDYAGKDKIQRDSGVSNGSGPKAESPLADGEIKAFPLVCVCLPQHWRKTVEGDGFAEGEARPGAGP